MKAYRTCVGCGDSFLCPTSSKRKYCNQNCYHENAQFSCNPGCTCNRHEQSEAHKRRAALSRTGLKRGPHTEETRAKISKRHKEIGHKPPSREGSKQTYEWKSGQSARMFERYNGPEGELHRAELSARNTELGIHPPPQVKHGLTYHRHYKRWLNMIQRCEDPNAVSYKSYGGRGIQVCKAWHDPRVFIEYLESELPPYQEGLSLDRIDTDGNYEPGNVRWATAKEQSANRRRRRR